MMPHIDQSQYSKPGSTPIFGTPFLIEKLSSGADSTTNISQTLIKVTIHVIPTYPTFVECCACSVTQSKPIPTGSLRFHDPNQANTIQ